MKVMKFGGTSVGSPQRMQHVAQLINDGEQNFVVLSAMSGTTNSLLEISDYFRKKNIEAALSTINALESKYRRHVGELLPEGGQQDKAYAYVREVFAYLRTFAKSEFTGREEKLIVAQGELLSTHLMTFYLVAQGMDVCLLPALDFMRTDANAEPDQPYIRQHLSELLDDRAGHDLYITQGFICRNHTGEVDNLLRGGSDYTASLVGVAVDASEIQIWTDIDGMHNNDPRYVDGTKPVAQLNFEEAAELGYFGAKILHPTCIQPAKFAGIPVKLLNTMDPAAPGTIINNDMQRGTIKAVAAKDGITAISISSSRMLLAYGFLRKVFEVFETYKTAIDMICTSEVGVSVTIDNSAHLVPIINELKQLGTVRVDKDMCIICIVGDLDWHNVGFETTAAEAMRDIPVRMISYGGSDHNISFLVAAKDKIPALQALSKQLFND